MYGTVGVCVSRPGRTHTRHAHTTPRTQWRRKLRGGRAARHPLAPRWPKLNPQVRDRRPRRLTPLLPALNQHPARVCAAPEAGRASAAPGRGRSGQAGPGRTPPPADPRRVRRAPPGPRNGGPAAGGHHAGPRPIPSVGGTWRQAQSTHARASARPTRARSAPRPPVPPPCRGRAGRQRTQQTRPPPAHAPHTAAGDAQAPAGARRPGWQGRSARPGAWPSPRTQPAPERRGE